LDRCLDGLRRELTGRHRAAHAALRRHLPPQCKWAEPDGGLVLWLELPEPGQGDRLAELAAARGVRTVPGRVFDPEGRPSRGLRLSLSRADQERIARGVEVLGACARDVLLPSSPKNLFL